jgi:hypothetical protein
MIGPTIQGVRDLIALDPSATWDPVSETVADSCTQQSPSTCPAYVRSPRIVVVPVFDTGAYEDGRQTGRLVVRVVNILGFFIDRVQGNDILGYLVTASGLVGGGNGNLNDDSAFTKAIVLVR